MAGDAEATRRRLLDAAAAEFAEHGIAGARVDRIAGAARSNKAQIYHYFTNKDGLYEAVIRELTEVTAREAPIDATDLPEYAGRLFDRFAADPAMARLAEWYCLEGADYASVDAVVAGTENKLSAITAAQADGKLPDLFTPVEILALVVQMASVWRSMSPGLAPLAEDIPHERRRRVVVAAVAALLRD